MYRLILVDDEPWVLSGLEELLDWEDFGFSIIGRYTDSQEALEQICRLRPDAVVTDIRMPNMTGIELIGAMKKEKCAAEIVLISAYRDFEAAREAIRFGACHYIMKPFEQEEVEETLHVLAEKLRLRNEPILVDPSDPVSLSAPQVEYLFREAAYYPLCCLLLSDNPGYRPADANGVRITPIRINKVPSAFLISARSREAAVFAAPETGHNPADSVGSSRIHTDFSFFPVMLEEALQSLQHGFIFSGNRLAADIQMFLCHSISGNLSLSEVALKFHLSDVYLSSMFKKYTGDTITAFIQDIRTYRAARMLLHSDRELKEIAAGLGYSDYSYFGRLFKRRFGLSPEAYRSCMRLSAEL
jgi:two-component system response regulator YesN